MTITTAQDIVTFSLKAAGVVGVGQTPLSADLTDSFDALNMMLGIWTRNRWLIWHLLDAGATCTGAEYYTVGPGKQIDIPRPDRIEAAYLRQLVGGAQTITTDPGGAYALQADGAAGIQLAADGLQTNPGMNVDYPLTILESREDYSRIALKGLVSFSWAAFYDAAFPTGALYPWPIPPASTYEIHILVKDTLAQFATLSTAINLPPEYYEALWSNLALRLRAIYKLPAPVGPDDVKDIAKGSLETIRNSNAQIPRLRMPQSLTRPPLYNIFAGPGFSY